MSEQKAASTRANVALTEGLGGIIGVKAGMTQVFNDKGEAEAVTVIDLSQANVVTQVKSLDKDKYRGVQVGVGEKKAKAVRKPEQGHVKKSGSTGFQHYQELRFPDSAKLEGVEAGAVLSPDFIKEGDLVDLTAISKGKGFQGTMKRFNYAGGMASHGASVCHRSLGSIGNRADPGKVFKGKGMAGHMGHERVTIQNAKVIRVDNENKVLLVRGSVPGPRSGLVTVRKALKGGKQAQAQA